MNILNEELSKIKSMMGLLNEQSSGQLISDRGYKAILSFENKKGTPNGDNSGAASMNYSDGDERMKESIIRDHINNTIGLNRWFKISDLFRTQIYSFMFNSDSKNNDLFRWLSGLAQSIDNTIDRGSITGKNINDQNVKDAIQLINNTIDGGKINNYYNNYVKNVLDKQYTSIMNSNTETDKKGNVSVKPWFKAAYTYSWSVRPQEIEQYYNGTHPDMKSEKKVVTTTTPVNKSTPVNKPTPTTGQKKLVIKTPDLTSFMEAIKTGTVNKTFDLTKVDINVDDFTTTLVEDSKGTKILKMVLAVSLSGQNCESCKSILAKNNAQVVDKGTFEGGKRIYNLIAIIS
jgi:hypothetical protein